MVASPPPLSITRTPAKLLAALSLAPFPEPCTAGASVLGWVHLPCQEHPYLQNWARPVWHLSLALPNKSSSPKPRGVAFWSTPSPLLPSSPLCFLFRCDLFPNSCFTSYILLPVLPGAQQKAENSRACEVKGKPPFPGLQEKPMASELSSLSPQLLLRWGCKGMTRKGVWVTCLWPDQTGI